MIGVVILSIADTDDDKFVDITYGTHDLGQAMLRVLRTVVAARDQTPLYDMLERAYTAQRDPALVAHRAILPAPRWMKEGGADGSVDERR